MKKPDPIRAETLRVIRAELIRARKQYPTNQNTLRSLKFFVEQLEIHLAGDDTALAIFSHAITVAVMAIRVAEEGDAKFRYASYLQAPGPLFDPQIDATGHNPNRATDDRS